MENLYNNYKTESHLPIAKVIILDLNNGTKLLLPKHKPQLLLHASFTSLLSQPNNAIAVLQS